MFLCVCMCFQMCKLLMTCETNPEQTSHRESDELFAFILGLNSYRQCVQMMHSIKFLPRREVIIHRIVEEIMQYHNMLLGSKLLEGRNSMLCVYLSPPHLILEGMRPSILDRH